MANKKLNKEMAKFSKQAEERMFLYGIANNKDVIKPNAEQIAICYKIIAHVEKRTICKW